MADGLIVESDRPAPAAFAPPRGCTFSPGDWAVLARHWFAVAWAADVGATPAAVRLLDVPLVVYRAAGQVVVAHDLCVHRGVPLSLGRVEGDEIICRYHGLRYGPDGRCRFIPAEPSATPPSPRLRIPVYPVQERYGLIWTSLDPDADPAALPVFPEWDDPALHRVTPPFMDIAGSAGRQCEGFLDVAHFAFVHHGTFADPDNAVVPSYAVHWAEDGTLVSDYISDVGNAFRGSTAEHDAPDGFLWRRLYEVQLPFCPRLTIFLPNNHRLCLFNAATPSSARLTRLFVPIARSFGHDDDVAAVHAFNLRVFEEDRVIVEAQRPEDLPLDLAAEAHIRADRASIAYRQGLARLGLGRDFTS